jgi:Meckel syndrome type 1 protein
VAAISPSSDAALPADAPRALPGAAPLPAMIAQADPAAIAPVPPPADTQPHATLPDPGQQAPGAGMGAAPDTPPSVATGGASAVTLAAPAPEPPAAPARPHVPIPWPARQVVPFAVSLALGSDDSISLTLDPVELGRVEVAITRGAEAHVSLRAERPETLALLQRDRAELERALAGTGFGAEGRAPNMSFGLGFGGSGDDRRDRRPADRDGQGARPGTHTPAPPPHQAVPTARGLIDLAF